VSWMRCPGRARITHGHEYQPSDE